MTIEEKKERIKCYCNARWKDGNLCSASEKVDGCPLYGFSGSCYEEESDYVINRNYKLLFGTDDKDEQEETKPYSVTLAEAVEKVVTDMVNHPSHYTNGGMECIDEMILIFGRVATMDFCLLNAWKYRKRALYKNGQEDMDKADWYLAKFKELSEHD